LAGINYIEQQVTGWKFDLIESLTRYRAQSHVCHGLTGLCAKKVVLYSGVQKIQHALF